MEAFVGGMAEKKLYDAAAIGDFRVFQELLYKDPFLLDRVSYTSPHNTPLHVATTKGHLAIVHEILSINPQLAEELNSNQSSPLHIASAKGYLEIARKLFAVAPNMCLARDCQGKNPLHLAAMKGQVQVLAELLWRAPLAAREKVDRGLTVLHLCVKHGQLETLKVLVQEFNELINAKNDDGDTLLHMAVMGKQVEIIRYLVGSTNIDVNAKNANEQTAMTILEQSPLDTTNSEIRKILSNALGASDIPDNQRVKWLTKKRDSIMVVAILIATMAFQVGVSPAGGVYQEDLIYDSNGNRLPHPHRAGEAIMAHLHARAYKNFIRANSIAFVSSLSTILLLISGLPFRRRLLMWALMVIMWLTITSIAITYAISVAVVTPKKDRKSLGHIISVSLFVWISVMGILLVGNTIRLLDRWLKNKGVVVWRPRMFRNSAEVNCENARQETI